MKEKILLTVSLAAMLALTVTGTTVSSNTAFAIQNYLQLRSATVTENGNIDVDIRTGGNIPSEKGNSGFGYAVLTDVGDEFVNNVLVAITDIGLDDYDESRNDKLHTHVFDLTGDVSSDCSGSDYEVDRSSSDNEAFDTNYPLSIRDNEVSIDDVDTGDLAGDTVKAIGSFTADAVTHNGKIQHICIDIQDVLKQSEISVSYDDDDDNGNRDDNGDGKDDDDGSKDTDDDNSDIDIDQDIDQSNECSGGANCSNGGSNEANVASSSSNSDGFGIDIDQDIDQSNTCSGEADCSNEGSNEANIWEDDGSDKTGIDIDQSIKQSNECDDEASCSNEGANEANVLGYPSISDDEEFGFDIDIGQSTEQSNTCGSGATCSNQASNVANIG